MEQTASKLQLQFRESEKEDPFLAYQDCLDQKIPLGVTFDFADARGNLLFKDENGVQIVLEESVLKEALPYYSSDIKGKFLCVLFHVRVISIDREHKKVFVSNTQSKISLTKTINAHIRTELQNGKTPIVYGRVETINPTGYLVVDILGKGIKGRLNVKNWSNFYTRSLVTVCQVNDLLPFEIIRQRPIKSDNKEIIWELSRKNLTSNPWEKIPKELFEPDANMLVTCIDKPIGKSYFWSISPVVPGIEIMCNYTTHQKFPILVGCTYKCKVKEIRLDSEKPMFKVTPFAVSEESRGSITLKKNVKPVL